MKKFAFLVAFALLALTLPMSAVETPAAAPEAAPVTPLQQSTEQPDPLLKVIGPVITPYCHTIHGTTCTAQPGTKRSCTDVCGNNLSCTCTTFNGKKYWYCNQEC